MDFVWFVLVGLVAGWLAGQLVKGGGFGVIGDIVVGVLGAVLGGFLFRAPASRWAADSSAPSWWPPPALWCSSSSCD